MNLKTNSKIIAFFLVVISAAGVEQYKRWHYHSCQEYLEI